MSSLEELKYALESAGHSSEQIEEAEKSIIQVAAASLAGIEQVAHAALCAFWTMKSFSDCIDILQECKGISADQLEEVSHGLLQLGKLGSQPLPPMPVEQVKPTERVPYYHKKKQQWWK